MSTVRNRPLQPDDTSGSCADNRIRLLGVRRAHLEIFARTMEQKSRMRSILARRVSALCRFNRPLRADTVRAVARRLHATGAQPPGGEV